MVHWWLRLIQCKCISDNWYIYFYVHIVGMDYDGFMYWPFFCHIISGLLKTMYFVAWKLNCYNVYNLKLLYNLFLYIVASLQVNRFISFVCSWMTVRMTSAIYFVWPLKRLTVASLVFVSLCGSLPSSLEWKIIQTNEQTKNKQTNKQTNIKQTNKQTN